MTCDQCGRHVARGRGHADHPSQYVDPIAVERAAAGDRVHVTPKERRAAVHLLTARGLSAPAIAERLNIAPRSVVRHRGRPPVAVSDFGR